MKAPAITALITIRENAGYYLPDAHFREFGGKPLFQRFVDMLLTIKEIHHVVVTTDSERVRRAYRTEGLVSNRVTLLDHPDPETYFSQDTNERILEEMPTSDKMTAFALEKTDQEHFIQVQAINPLLTTASIRDAIDKYYQYVLNDEYGQQFDSVMSLARVEKRLYDNSNYPTITLRDDPHFVVFEDTVLHVFNRNAFRKNGNKKFGKNPMFFEIPEIENLTAETEAGYQLAKLAFDNKKLFSQILER